VKVFITSTSTVGKSTVIKELERRGFAAIDGDDEPELCRLEVKATSEAVEWPKGYVDWSYYAWNLQEAKLKQLLTQNETVFLAGIFGNQSAYYHLFDKLVVLTITPEEHAKRLQGRHRRSAGDDEQNMADRLTMYPVHLQRFLDAGAIPIDASGTAITTADAILELIQHDDK
jgi:dephospho-CoA kinase